MNILTIRDETIYGQVLHEQSLALEEDTLTVHALIARRVRNEVERFNRRQEPYFCGLVQPHGSLSLPPGFRLNHPRRLKSDVQIKAALQAFREGRFLVIIDGYTVTRLDQRFEAYPKQEISFLLMTPVQEEKESD